MLSIQGPAGHDVQIKVPLTVGHINRHIRIVNSCKAVGRHSPES